METLVIISVLIVSWIGGNGARSVSSIDPNPEDHMNVSQIIRYYGYPCELHSVMTHDGYLLSLQRIPYGKKTVQRKNEVVFLQHGLLDSAATWVMNMPHESFAFILADDGYDVWLGNNRGNTYSRRHINMTVKDAKFWQFSFEEMAQYDLPAMVDYALKYTGTSQLQYVGHSQGTMIGFIEFGRNKELAKKIKGFHALAPVATIGHIKGALKVLSNFATEIRFLYRILGVHQFLPNDWLMKFVSEVICALSPISEKFCGDLLFLMTGFDQKNLNISRISVYSSHTPAGTSVKNVVHYVQMIKSGKFRKYDYGPEGNQLKYNQPTPPQFDVSLMETPVSLFSGSEDWLADPYDINHSLKPYLRNIVYDKAVHGWNHMDFIWGKYANKVIFQDVIKLMKKS